MSRNIYHLNWYENQFQGFTHIIARGIINLNNIRANVNLMCGVYVHHCRGCHAVIRKYSEHTEAEIKKNQIDSF